MYRNPESPSRLRGLGISFLLGLGLFALGALVQAVLDRLGVHGIMVYADDLLAGVLAGMLVFAYERSRRKVTLDKIRVIAAMNHHVRNALQAITFSPYAEQAKQIELIQNAARRIQWALDEILPGETQPDDVPAQGPRPS